MAEKVIIGGELEPQGMSGVVSDSKYILDRDQEKNQSEINVDLYDKIAHIQPGTEQIQSDWNQTDTEAKDFIKNKPASAISGRIWIGAGNSSADIINDSNLYPDYVYGTPLEIPANNNKLILAYTINVEVPLKMYVGGVEVPYDKSTGAGYHVLTSKNNYNGTVVVVVK